MCFRTDIQSAALPIELFPHRAGESGVEPELACEVFHMGALENLGCLEHPTEGTYVPHAVATRRDPMSVT